MDELTEKLQEFKDHEDPVIQNIVRELLTLNDGLDQVDLTKEQFEELAEDILELHDIRRMATTLERKTMLLQTINAIRYVIEGVLL